MAGLFEDAPDPTTATAAPPSTGEAKPTETVSVAQVVAKIDDKIEGGKAQILGALCFWSFTGIEISRDDLIAKVKAAGLPEKIVPLPEARGAFKDAVECVKIKCRIGRHKVDEDCFAFSFDEPELHHNGSATVDVGYRVDQVVEYRYSTKTLTFKTSFMETEIRAAFTKYLTTLQSNDMRTVVMRALLGAKAITVREKGGVYFVPRQDLEVVKKLKALCASVGGGADFFRVHILDTEEDRQDMTKAVGSEIEKEIAEAETDFAAFVKQASESNKAPRADVLQRRIDEFKRIRAKAQAYKDLLHYKAEGVEERLTKLNEIALGLVA